MPTLSRPRRFKPITIEQATEAIVRAAREPFWDRVKATVAPTWRRFQGWRNRWLYTAPCPVCGAATYRRRVEAATQRTCAENCTMHPRNAHSNGSRW